MTLNEKIERIRELLARRDEIETELAGLLGGSIVDEPTPRAKSPKPKATEPKPTKTEKGKRTVTCKKCGKPGHQAKTCAAAVTASPPSFGDKEILTEDQFDDLKHLQSIGDLISKDFAADNDLPLAQVNRAIACRNFEEYANF